MMATGFLADEDLFLLHPHVEDIGLWGHGLLHGFPVRPITLGLCALLTKYPQKTKSTVEMTVI